MSQSCTIPYGKAQIVGPLEAVLPGRLEYPECGTLEGFRGERIHFQVVCIDSYYSHAKLKISGPLAKYASVRVMDYIPCLSPAEPADPDVITHEPGLFPGVLSDDEELQMGGNAAVAFWITLDLPKNCRPGESELKVDLFTRVLIDTQWDGPHSMNLPVKIFPAVLPPQKLVCEHWFYADCLMTHYKVKCWSKEHWRIIGNYFKNMAMHGMDSLLTPLWTVPLDTLPGGERPTAQLLIVSEEKGRYRFDFRRLKKWIELARTAGIRKFSLSHIFTQWGAEFTPKIMVRKKGNEVRRFGWDVASDSAEYRSFLQQLFPALFAFFKRCGVPCEDVYVHLSDEPGLKHLEFYGKGAKFVRALLPPGVRTLDALSRPDFYDQGLVDVPVPTTSHMDRFAGRELPERWCYYSGDWEGRLSNRKLGTSPLRNRILGVMLYLLKMDGFLQWGYNFWYSTLSRRHLDPLDIRQLSRVYGVGTAFMVLPGEDGKPLDCANYEVFSEGLQDLRALQLLERRIGREAVLAVINEGRSEPLTIHNWPDDPEFLLSLRRRIAEKLSQQTV